DDLVMLWSLVKEISSSTEPTDDKERTLWVELKRLFEPDTDDTLWKLQSHKADNFNAFIDSSGLIDLPIGGCYYTWMNKAGTKLSKLDRFLISDDILEAIPDIRITALDRLWSDHTPILFHVEKSNFGLFPFKLTTLVIDKKIDDGSTNENDRENRIKLLQDIDNLDNLEAHDLIQKAHIKWDIEGDENSNFFMGLLIKRGDPNLLPIIFSPLVHSTGLCPNDHDFLKTRVTLEEVKFAVWDCGSNKAPGPDGFSFAFVKKYWDLLKKDIFEFVDLFLASGTMPQDDVIITTEWNPGDLDNIIRVLHVFYLASGTRVVGVPNGGKEGMRDGGVASHVGGKRRRALMKKGKDTNVGVKKMAMELSTI
ncbi:RNA-directed DNA polymerase, eukaryota, reverse transcriptase zinc-binding domain protein, partial [Tanacetum coccineum]